MANLKGMFKKQCFILEGVIVLESNDLCLNLDPSSGHHTHTHTKRIGLCVR